MISSRRESSLVRREAYSCDERSSRLGKRSASRTSRLSFAEGAPAGRAVAQVHLLELPKQVHQALLLEGRYDVLVGAPEIRDQDAGEGFGEELLERRLAPRAVDHVVGRRARRKAPQPMQYPGNTPAGLVGANHPAGLDLFADLFVPGI